MRTKNLAVVGEERLVSEARYPEIFDVAEISISEVSRFGEASVVQRLSLEIQLATNFGDFLDRGVAALWVVVGLPLLLTTEGRRRATIRKVPGISKSECISAILYG